MKDAFRICGRRLWRLSGGAAECSVKMQENCIKSEYMHILFGRKTAGFAFAAAGAACKSPLITPEMRILCEDRRNIEKI